MFSLSLTYYLCLFAELLYPTYASLRAIQSTSKIDDTQVVYAFISTFESVGMMILSWIPLYYEIKLLAVIWMIAPQTQLTKYGDKIDPIFGKADAALKSNIVNELAKYVDKHGPKIAEQLVSQAQDQAQKMGKLASAAAAEHLKNVQQAAERKEH
ncbi:hypothetical protein GPECTOR_1g787 [Gonium pectorale]|uniref:HVA22-like protein n=1 Tax=Gonium pectorale TaxID=33097 RepID=A0A150H496_GONPE|nr:hypothetical protein GPECTOR_1g787 [Gonium pectorale]|eukprot:KXZ56872.1 hypothetical protein GPECTOR_1g787 [Gonium pectorale]